MDFKCSAILIISFSLSLWCCCWGLGWAVTIRLLNKCRDFFLSRFLNYWPKLALTHKYKFMVKYSHLVTHWNSLWCGPNQLHIYFSLNCNKTLSYLNRNIRQLVEEVNIGVLTLYQNKIYWLKFKDENDHTSEATKYK